MQLATVGTTNDESMFRPARSGSVQSFARASLAEFAWIVHMPGSPEFKRDQEIEAFGLAHLADDEPVGPHAKRLFDEPSERDLAGALEARLAALQRDEVAHVEIELERLLDGHDPLTGARGGHEGVHHRRLARVRRTRHEDVRPCQHAHTKELRRPRRQRSEFDELRERADASMELADVDGPVCTGDVGNRDVQPGTVGQGSVDEGRREVDAATRVLEHPLDQLAHLAIREHQRRELGHAIACDEDARRRVDPDLFDFGVVEIRLQRPVARDRRDDLARRAVLVVELRVRPGECPLAVAAHFLAGIAGGDRIVFREIEALAQHPGTHSLGDGAHGVGHGIHLVGQRMSRREVIHSAVALQPTTRSEQGHRHVKTQSKLRASVPVFGSTLVPQPGS